MSDLPTTAAVVSWYAEELSFGQTSVVSGWIPLVVQLIGAAAVVGALWVRPLRWWLLRPPMVVVIAAAIAAVIGLQVIVDSAGYGGEPAPFMFWAWGGLTGAAVAVVIIVWPTVSWWRRIVALLPIPLCLLCLVVMFNVWVGYARTTQSAWQFVAGGPPPNQADIGSVRWMADHGRVPRSGRIVPVDTGDDASGFRHRGELVYLPPAWFTTTPPPPLPVVVLVGGAFGSSADWLWAGKAQQTADDYARAHGGNAPVLAFVDKGGIFNADTQCVNGTRGNAADHITKDVVPFMKSTFGVSDDSRNWAIAGWSMGGTCAVTLAVKHPELFQTFVDVEGSTGPGNGTKEQTMNALFGGTEAAWAAFDPASVMQRHGTYADTAGVFAVEGPADSAASAPLNPSAIAAQLLSETASAHGISASIVSIDGTAGWGTGVAGLARTFDWLAGRIRVPGAGTSAQPGMAVVEPAPTNAPVSAEPQPPEPLSPVAEQVPG